MATAFNPEKHLINLQGKDYLPVAPRRQWAIEQHPDWRIVTEELFADETAGIYRFKAQVIDGEGNVLATGHGRETMKGFALGPYEKAETIAIGRALAMAGVGTLQALEFAEDRAGERPADAPVERKGGQRGGSRPGGQQSGDEDPFSDPGESERPTIKDPEAISTASQQNFIKGLFKDKGYPDKRRDEIIAKHYNGKTLDQLTKGEASHCIQAMQNMPKPAPEGQETMAGVGGD